MRVLVEIVADDREAVFVLLRTAARQIKKEREGAPASEVQHCIGAYRIIVDDDDKMLGAFADACNALVEQARKGR